MEIVRQQLGSGDKGEFRSRQLTARRMLHNELDGPELEEFVEQRLATGIPQRFHAGQPLSLIGETLVEDVIAGHD